MKNIRNNKLSGLVVNFTIRIRHLSLMSKMKKTPLYILPLVLLTSCVAPTQESYVGPSGSAVTSVKCSQSPKACFQQASRACNGRSYQVLDSESHAGGLVADILPGPVTWYGMTFQCGPSDGRMPGFPFRGQQYRPPSVTNCQAYGTTVSCQSY